MAEASAASPKKTVKLSSLKIDLEKERSGEWKTAHDLDSAISWHVRSTNYPPFKLARAVATKKLAEQYGNDIPDDALAAANGRLAVEYLLLDWKGLDETFSPEVAAIVLTDEAHRLVRDSVYLAAVRVGRGEVEYVETTEKKLRAALRYNLERKGTDEWLEDIAEEEPGAEEYGAGTRPKDAFVPVGAEVFWEAWHSLQFDRQYGAMGGESPLSFIAIDTYARRVGVSDTEFGTFYSLVTAMDDEFLQHRGRVRKSEEEAAANRQKAAERGA